MPSTLVAILALLLVGNTIAEHAEPKAAREKSKAAASPAYDFFPPDFTDDQLKSLTDTLQLVDKTLKGEFEPPLPRVNVAHVNGAPRHSTGQLYLALAIPLDKDPSRSSKLPEPIWAHEYSHAYFDRGMRKANPTWKKWAEEEQKLVPAAGEWFPKLSPEEQKALRKKISDSSEWLKLKRLTAPYDELFADVVTVVAMKDGTAMRRALEAMGDAPGVKERDFTLDHRPGTKRAEGWDLGDAHEALAPARTAIWQKYQAESRSPTFSPAVFVRTVFNVIAADIEDRTKEKDPLALSTREANERLLTLIRTADYSTGKVKRPAPPPSNGLPESELPPG